jgi:hypothetical protein
MGWACRKQTGKTKEEYKLLSGKSRWRCVLANRRHMLGVYSPRLYVPRNSDYCCYYCYNSRFLLLLLLLLLLYE